MRKSHRCIPRETREGAAAVEFAFVTPVILLFFIGAIEITQLNFLRHTAANAAYEGARAAIVPGGTAADAEAEALNMLTIAGVGYGAVITVNQVPDRIAVSVNVPVATNTWGLNTFTAGMEVVQSCELLRETSD